MGAAQSTAIEMVSTWDELEKKLSDPNATPMSLPLEFLRSITCDFSTEMVLGEGGYGVVYKGILRSGKIIAVKKLFEMRLREATYQKEVGYLMTIKHQNIVRLIGYCAESSWKAIEEPTWSGKYVLAEMPKRFLCFEYISNKSLDKHISDESLGLEWSMRYEIIKGICNGLHFLHDQCRIVHLDLKPENILMDPTMTPKIADFGLSRIFGEKQTRIITDSHEGTCGYMAPEYINQGIVSNKTDIFSLGVIFIEIITGHRDYPYFQQECHRNTAKSLHQFTEKVTRSWMNKFVSTPNYKPIERYTQQVRQCITIALECVDPSMEKRPTIEEIIRMFNTVDQVTTSYCKLLDVHPLELYFPVEPNKLIAGSLHLTNNKDKQVVFRLVEMNQKYNHECLLNLPLYNIVPPRCTYTLVITVTPGKMETMLKQRDVDLVLQAVASEKYITPSGYDYGQYFEKAKKDNEVHKLALKAIYDPQLKTSSEFILVEKTPRIMYSLDINRTEPWIITGHQDGYIDIWNYDTCKLVASVKTGDGCPVYTIKFIERKQWFVAGSMDGFICVYNYKTEVQKITSFRSETDARLYRVSSLAVHPTKPYVLSSCHPYIKLWNWEKNWECIQRFTEQSRSTDQLTFNPKDANSFASASSDHTVKIWSLDSLKPKYTLLGHSNRVNCLDFFTRDDLQYLITGSDDKTAKIWDMQTKSCIYTLEGFVSPVISVVSHPSLPVLVTGTLHGAIYLWSSTNFRLKRIINISGYGYAHGLACLLGSRRVVIANESALSIMEVHDEEPVTS
ncbi:uncharacterized protein [Lolium perenne]|uniref:uncharacterized protein isoform X2 n=1 Tax=Lolium perenne TaxID=4522 RepID=UPI0021F55C18|nr:uncharacterized protein LOC127312714 isoform X2 [Lolium perenne]